MASYDNVPNRVEVICGLSGSGKTTVALRHYAQQVARHGEDTALFILPTARVVQQIRVRLVEEGLVRGLVDPRIFTFPQLAQLILNANHECVTAIGRTTARLLLHEAIEHLSSSETLPELAEVSRLRGFVTVLAEFVGDLKRAGITPRQFCKALRDCDLEHERHRELGSLYCAYQWLLICLCYVDEEGQFWWARHV
ncbi:MAG: hypothetical protein ACUVX8_14500, partial [Candidatus Zipacnadales bacterium]